MGPKRAEFQGAERNSLIADRYGSGEQPGDHAAWWRPDAPLVGCRRQTDC